MTLKNGGVLNIYSDFLNCVDVNTERLIALNSLPPISDDREKACVGDSYNPNGDEVCWVYNIDYRELKGATKKFELVSLQMYPNRRDYTYRKVESIFTADKDGLLHLTYPVEDPTVTNKIYVTGFFNKWDERKSPMKLVNDHWELDLYVTPGNYKVNFLEVPLYRTLKSNKSLSDELNRYNSDSGSAAALDQFLAPLSAPQQLTQVPLWSNV